MPVVDLSNPVLVVVNVVAWAVVHSLSGFAVHKIPVRRLGADNWLFTPRRIERNGRFYTETLRIKRWKDRLPEAGALFAGGVSKRRVPAEAAGGLERFAAETRRAELGHWLAMAPAPLFALWNPPAIAVVMLVYAGTVNLPFIAIQRYNRIRLAGALARSRGSRSSSDARNRTERRTNGTNMP